MNWGVLKVAMSIGVTLFLPALMQSCCTGDLSSYFDVTGLKIKNIEDGVRTRNGSTYGPNGYREVSEAFVESYGLEVKPLLRYYTAVPAAALYACSPDEGGKGTSEIIEDIQVTSNSDFDEQHLAGSSLNDLFALEDIRRRERTELNRFLQSNAPAMQDGFILHLLKSPTRSMTHQFTIKYTHTDGEKFEETAKPIVLY